MSNTPDLDEKLKNTSYGDICDELDEYSKLLLLLSSSYFKILKKFCLTCDDEGKALFDEFDQYYVRLMTLDYKRRTAKK